MSAKQIIKKKSISGSKAKTSESSVRGTASKEATEEDIFMDKEELLREKWEQFPLIKATHIAQTGYNE